MCLGEVRKSLKNHESNKNFSCHVKRLSDKYIKSNKNNKFNKILHSEREKDKKGFEKSAHFAKIVEFVILAIFAIFLLGFFFSGASVTVRPYVRPVWTLRVEVSRNEFLPSSL